MRFPWTRIISAIADVFSRPKDPDAALPPAARDELDQWDQETIDGYYRDRRGMAADDAPKIPDDGQI